MVAVDHCREILKQEYANRCQRNSRYSLRAFARDIGIRSSRLSEILNGKVGLSYEKAKQIAIRLNFNKTEMARFLDLAESQHARSKVKRELAKARLRKYEHPQYRKLEMDAFQLISNWYHLAILELMDLDQFESSEKWIARALGITELEARSAIERLLRFNLATRLPSGRLKTNQQFTASPDGVPSAAIKKFHEQVIQKGLGRLRRDPLEKRDFSSVIMSIDKTKLPVVKQKIKAFRRELNQECAKEKQKDAVYCLAIQFFELTE